uniref:Uncharacterized protein LOC111115753 n=1 Tax=Crassostrea virginica TaxID=6565 RepID=A0A8B8C3P8_CRAVI|nr:uncharacterized protein LOC111115753 [Crassostrea virginica]
MSSIEMVTVSDTLKAQGSNFIQFVEMFVSSTPMKLDKSDASLLTTYTEVPCDDLEAGVNDISVCIKVREITPGLEDSGSNSSSEGSSNMLFNSFIQIHSGMSDFYKSSRPHIKTGTFSGTNPHLKVQSKHYPKII